MDLNYIVALVTGALLVILVISFTTRARVFCQYLKHMTGLELTPGEVQEIFKAAKTKRCLCSLQPDKQISHFCCQIWPLHRPKIGHHGLGIDPRGLQSIAKGTEICLR